MNSKAKHNHFSTAPTTTKLKKEATSSPGADKVRFPEAVLSLAKDCSRATLVEGRMVRFSWFEPHQILLVHASVQNI